MSIESGVKDDKLNTRDIVKRVEIQKEDWARERVYALRDAVKELRREIPEVVGFVGFGSLFKGESRPDSDPDPSDIDGFLYINPDYKKHSEEILEGTEEDDGQFYNLHDYTFNTNTADEYKSSLVYKIRNKHSLTDEQVKDIKVLPISTNIIDNILRRVEAPSLKHLEYEKERTEVDNKNNQKWEEYKKMSDDYYNGVTTEYPIYPIDLERPKYYGITSIPQNISKLFHTSIGGNTDLKLLRKYTLLKLSEMAGGEHIWKSIVEDVRYGEKDEYEDFPTNVNEAIKYYGFDK